jgi:3,4-dehydroadipyl-CoA semialdehyde dehydrogenase
MKLPNYVSGQWQEGTGAGEPLFDPVTGEELALISSQGIGVAAPIGSVQNCSERSPKS